MSAPSSQRGARHLSSFSHNRCCFSHALTFWDVQWIYSAVKLNPKAAYTLCGLIKSRQATRHDMDLINLGTTWSVLTTQTESQLTTHGNSHWRARIKHHQHAPSTEPSPLIPQGCPLYTHATCFFWLVLFQAVGFSASVALISTSFHTAFLLVG